MQFFIKTNDQILIHHFSITCTTYFFSFNCLVFLHVRNHSVKSVIAQVVDFSFSLPASVSLNLKIICQHHDVCGFGKCFHQITFIK